MQTYFLYDGLGSTRQLTDAAGSVAAAYEYDVFGALKAKTGTADTPFRFTGELQDSQVARGPYYLRARYYDPAIGRFLTRDPIAGFAMTPQSPNRYVYALNNPVNWVDPSGLQAEGALVLACGSGVGCVVVVGAGAAAACAASPVCRGLVAEGGAAVAGGLQSGAEAVGGFVKGLFSKKEPKPVYQPYPREDMVQPWYPSPGQFLPPNFQPPTGDPYKWMWRLVRAGAVGYVLEKTGLLDILGDVLWPPKE